MLLVAQNFCGYISQGVSIYTLEKRNTDDVILSKFKGTKIRSVTIEARENGHLTKQW